MTTPGGVQNLPTGALTLDTLASKLQDMSGSAMKSRAVERFPSTFSGSTGGDPSVDLSPFGILVGIWSEVNSLIANSDPADIQGPEDLPPLLLEFIEGLPVVGTFVELLEAILGDYDGDDEILQAIQQIFGPIRQVAGLVGRLLTLDTPVNPAQLSQNLWPLGTFPSAESISGSGIWVFNPSVTRTADSTGAVRVVADGTMKSLLGVPVAIAPNQEVEPSVFVQWSGYVGSTAPIQLHIAEYFRSGDVVTRVGTTVVTSLGPSAASGGWAELSGSYTCPADGSVNEIRGRLVVLPAATAGTFDFDDAGATFKIPSDWIAGLSDSLQAILARIQALIDTAVNALTGGSSTGNALQDLFEALGLIPPDNVQGSGGPATIGASIFGVIDAWLSGAVGAPGSSGGSLADVTNVSGQVASNAYLGGEAWRITNMLNNTPVARGMLPTGRANYDLTSANTYLATTQSAALSASMPVLQAMPIGVISWYGYGSSGITAFYVNIRKVNPTTGARDLVYHSGNVVSSLQPGTTAADADWMFCELDTPIAAQATDTYYVEFVPVGGTHNIRGMSFTDTIKDHPLAAAPCIGATVDYTSSPNSPTASLAKATAAPGVPWFEYAVSTSGAADHREPVREDMQYDGQTLPIPSWCNKLDLIPLGTGGDGAAGTILPPQNGLPGQPASFAPITFTRGTHWTDDSTLVTFNILEDGSAKLSIPGYDTTSAAGADGQGVQFGLQPVGRGPGVLDYNGQKYTGGVDQKAWGGPGANPGGGGNGGRGLALQGGGKGGTPIGFVCFRQEAVDGESSGGDTTPPNIDDLAVTVETTSTSVTLTITGAVDE